MAQNDNPKPNKNKLSIFIGLIIVIIALNLTLVIPNLLIKQPTYYSMIYLIGTILSFIIIVVFYTNSFDLKKTYGLILVLILILILAFPYIPQLGNMADVPYLIGEDQSDASMILDNRGLGVNIEYKTSIDSKRGKVIDQYPKEGIYLYKGTKINLIIGKGAAPKTTIISPNNNSDISSVQTKINGTLNKKLSSEEKIYVFVKPLPRSSNGLTSDGPYEWYTQPEVKRMANNIWVTNIFLGQEGINYDVGRNFLVAVVVSQENITTNSVYGFNLPQYESIQTITLTRTS